MIINKITTGFVVQQYDTEREQYIGQSFTAGNVDYEKADGTVVHPTEMASLGFGPFAPSGEPYLAFDMVQPRVKGEHCFNSETGHCIYCNCDEDDAFVGGEICSH